MPNATQYVKRRQRGLAVLIAGLVLIIGTIIYVGINVVDDESDYRGSGNGVVEYVEIAEGTTISELGPELEERGIVASAEVFQAAAFQNDAASNAVPGIYRLQQRMGAEEAVAALVDVNNQVALLDVAGGDTLADVTVVAGSTRLGIYSRISELTCEDEGNCISVADLENVAATADLDELGVPEWARDAVTSRGEDSNRLEGLIMPGQYVVNPNATAEEIIQDLIERSASAFEENDIEHRASSLGLTPYELLTAASLVERESTSEDFSRVARVILNRLDEGMRLEFDSTVNYGLEEQELATTDEDRATETDWNTYVRYGLPATPISAVSLQAIEAMENPAEGDWLYFVTVDAAGNTVFSNTYEEHLAAVDEAILSGVLDSNR